MASRELYASAAISEEAMWRTEKANRYKTKLCTCGGICGTITLTAWLAIIISLAFAGVGFPFLPNALLNYGWVYHVFNAPLVALCFVAGGVHNNIIVALIGLFSIPTVMLNLWTLGGNFIPWIVGCITANPITFFADCTAGSAFYMFMMTGVCILFVLVSLVVLYASFALYAYIHRGQQNITYALANEKKD